jgi:hypothetical protein
MYVWRVRGGVIGENVRAAEITDKKKDKCKDDELSVVVHEGVPP